LSPIEPLIDAVVAVCFLSGAVFYLMVAYVERRGMAWRFLGTAGAIWFVILFLKLINNMAEFPWVYGTVRAAVALTLGLYLLGIIILARSLQ
jgi:hypothetical protein